MGGTEVAPGLVRGLFELLVERSSEDTLCVLLFDPSSRLRLEVDGWGVGDALLEAGGDGGKVAGRGLVTGPSIYQQRAASTEMSITSNKDLPVDA